MCTPSEMMSFYTTVLGLTTEEALSKKIANSIVFNAKSKASRSQRYSALFVYIRNVLDRANLDIISEDLATFKFVDTYIELGREGSMKINYEGLQDKIGLFDYIQGTTEWTDNNYPTFEERMGTPLYGITPEEVISTCLNIIDNGNY